MLKCPSFNYKLFVKCVINCLNSVLFALPILIVAIVGEQMYYYIIFAVFIICRVFCVIIFKDNLGCVIYNLFNITIHKLLRKEEDLKISLPNVSVFFGHRYKMFYVILALMILYFISCTAINTILLIELVTLLFIKAVIYIDYTSKILPSVLVFIFYIYDTFRCVDQKYARFLDKLVQILEDDIKNGVLECGQSESSEHGNTMLQYILKSGELVSFCTFKSDTVINIEITHKLFLKIICINTIKVFAQTTVYKQ